jgi:hypothetical protein
MFVPEPLGTDLESVGADQLHPAVRPQCPYKHGRRNREMLSPQKVRKKSENHRRDPSRSTPPTCVFAGQKLGAPTAARRESRLAMPGVSADSSTFTPLTCGDVLRTPHWSASSPQTSEDSVDGGAVLAAPAGWSTGGRGLGVLVGDRGAARRHAATHRDRRIHRIQMNAPRHDKSRAWRHVR